MIEEIEIWKDVKDFEGVYKVSNMGRVKSLKFNKEKILKGCKDNLGYDRVALCKNNKIKKITIHRLVGFAFISNPENKPEVNHKDNNPSNNKVSNLEWMTSLENKYHCINQGRKPKGEKCSNAKLTQKNVDEIRLNKDNLLHRELGEIFKVSRSLIGMIINHKTWK